jgi:hypothetical protein
MLHHMSGAVLVEGEILAVATIMQGLEGQEYVRVHGVDLVLPPKMVAEGAPYLASILLGCELFHMLPCICRARALMEDGPNLLWVSEEGKGKGSIGL